MRPRVAVDGSNEAMDQIGPALAQYKRFEMSGKQRQTIALGDCVALFEKGKIKIIALVSEYVIFVGNPATFTFYCLFLDVVPASWPVFSKLLPPTPTFFPVYPDELAVPLYDRCNFYVSGGATPYQSEIFSSPILSIHSEFLLWQGLMLEKNIDTGNKWLFLRYNLEGYLNTNALPIYTKMCLSSDDGSVIDEFTDSAPIMHVVSSQAVSNLLRFGIFYRRLKVSEDVEKIVMHWHDDSYHSGSLYEVIEYADALYTIPLDLPATADGDRLDPPPSWKGTPVAGSRRVDNMMDIFTSERAAHYYVVLQTIDSAVDYHMGFVDTIYDSQGSDTYLFPGTNLIVEKRLKADMSLVQTFNLNPSAIDTVLQGFDSGAGNIRVYANGCINASGTFQDPDLPIITRFIAQNGFVLVAGDGTEYPLLACASVSQDFYQPGDANQFSQAALLWLGTPPDGFDCWTWFGVDAVGLKISEAVTAARNDAGIGDMRLFGHMIGDSDNLLLALDAPYTAITFTAAGYSGDHATVSCANFGGRSTLDSRVGLTVGDQFYVDDALAYTVAESSPGSGTPEDASIIVVGIMAAVNAGSAYTATGLGSHLESGITVRTFTLTRIDGAPVTVSLGYTSIWGYRLERRVISVRLVDGLPIAKLENVQHKDQPIYMFDI